jgi:hypothetical protein
VDDSPLVAKQYLYELHDGAQTLAIGWLTSDEKVEAGDEVTIAGVVARVAGVAWTNGGVRLLLEPRRLWA